MSGVRDRYIEMLVDYVTIEGDLKIAVDYVADLEQQRIQMIDIIKNILLNSTKDGWIWCLLKPIIETATGRKINEVINEYKSMS